MQNWLGCGPTGLKSIDDLEPVELVRFSSLMYPTITDIWDQLNKSPYTPVASH
jgi:hypothetical protein